MKTQSFVRRVLFVVFFAVIAAFFVASSVIASDDLLPTWRSVTGKFSVEASLVRVTADSAVLKREDGSEVVVPLERLDQPSLVMVLRFMNRKPIETSVSVSTKSPEPANELVPVPFLTPPRQPTAKTQGKTIPIIRDTVQEIIGLLKTTLPKINGTEIQIAKSLQDVADGVNDKIKDRKFTVKFVVKNTQQVWHLKGNPIAALGHFLNPNWMSRQEFLRLNLPNIEDVGISDVIVSEGTVLVFPFHNEFHFDLIRGDMTKAIDIGGYPVPRADKNVGLEDGFHLVMVNFSQRIEHAKK